MPAADIRLTLVDIAPGVWNYDAHAAGHATNGRPVDATLRQRHHCLTALSSVENPLTSYNTARLQDTVCTGVKLHASKAWTLSPLSGRASVSDNTSPDSFSLLQLPCTRAQSRDDA